MGYRYTFKKEQIDRDYLLTIYHLILNYEDQINKSIVTKKISQSSTPLTDLLIADTYLITLELNDYFIRALEITMETYHYQNDLLYNFDQVCKELLVSFNQEYQKRYKILKSHFQDIPIKEIFNTIKTLSSNDAICAFYHSLKTEEPIEPGIISNIFLKEYLIALFFLTISKYFHLQ